MSLKSISTVSKECNNILQLFENQVSRFPNKIAVVMENESLTYYQLNTYANQFANYLRALDIKFSMCVGILMSRSIDVIVSVLGVLKSGCSYIAIDPLYPKERLSYMVSDSKISFLITQNQLLEGLSEKKIKDKLKLICFDLVRKDILKQKKTSPNIKIKKSDVAFIVYTSGTTGYPKGVITSHANIFYYLQSLKTAIEIRENDCYLHTASIAFSSSNRQLLLSLISGGRLVISSFKEVENPLLLFKLIKKEKITIIDFVPSYLRSCIKIVSEINKEEKNLIFPNKVRLVLTASEVLTSDLPDLWRKKIDLNTTFINMYGATETTGIMMTYTIPQKESEKIAIVPIGRPINGMSAYILNDELELINDGRIGSLYVTGKHVTLGYLTSSDTRRKFISNPYEGKNSIMYNTGDLCYRRKDGVIEYIGRKDHQIKMYGIRIEPKEIELTLNAYPLIKESIVTSKKINKEKFLIAYIVKEKDLNEKKLRDFIKKKLPNYMIPSYFISIDSLPLTTNGKLDRNNLPEVTSESLCINSMLIDPRNNIEEFLLEDWKRTLKTNYIGIFDDFFEIGGDSFRGLGIVSRISIEYKTSIKLLDLFNHPTIAKLATHVQKKCAEKM